jgi:acyl-CoA synthetase (AMP-forming)/AMP-acid ligase II
MRMIDFFDRGADIQARRTCVRDGSVSMTYAEVRRASHRIANHLATLGAQRETRVAVYSPNAAYAFVAVIGIFRAGCTWMPVNTRNTIEEIRAYLDDNDCAVLMFHSSLLAQARGASAGLARSVRLVCLDQVLPGVDSLQDWLETASDRLHDAGGCEQDVAVVKSTGGTTGRSKSVLHTNRNMEAMIANLLACVNYPEPPVYLIAIPMTHGAGTIAMAMMVLGATMVLHERADPVRILDAFENEGVTATFLTPTVIYSLLAQPGVRQRKFPALRHLVYGGAPMSAARLAESIEVFGPVMATCYGQVEALLICTWMSPEEHFTADGQVHPTRLKSCGRKTPMTRLEIMDDKGRLLGSNEVGEIVVRGGHVMKGYHNNPAETAAVSRFGWHHTGDVGLRDDDGYFYIVDRKKDMIISGGFNIYPGEIEQVLWRHAAVQDCAVIGVPDDKWGESLMAIVQLKQGAQATPDELIAHCRAGLSSMKTPRKLEIWDELPRSEVGKVLKRAIRERFWSGRERSV